MNWVICTLMYVLTEEMQVLLGVPTLHLVMVARALRTKVRMGRSLDGSDLIMQEELQELNLMEAKGLLKELTYGRWQKRWDNSDKGRIIYDFLNNGRLAANMTRNLTLYAGYLLTGHGS